jgi:hypothetical protein
MLRRVLQIVLLLALGCVFGFDSTTESTAGSSYSYHSDRGVEERMVLCNHTHLNLPTSFETLSVRVSTSLRGGSKTSSRHHSSWNTPEGNSNKHFSQKYGRPIGLHAAIGNESRMVLNRLCRLRI